MAGVAQVPSPFKNFTLSVAVGPGTKPDVPGFVPSAPVNTLYVVSVELIVILSAIDVSSVILLPFTNSTVVTVPSPLVSFISAFAGTVALAALDSE